jgi:hypothetical protein
VNVSYTETCPCGSRFEVEATGGWGMRTFDISEPLDDWRRLHLRHMAQPRRTGPTKAQLARMAETRRRVLDAAAERKPEDFR